MLYELNKLYNSCIGFPLSSAHTALYGSYNCISDWSRPIEPKRFLLCYDGCRAPRNLHWMRGTGADPEATCNLENYVIK